MEKKIKDFEIRLKNLKNKTSKDNKRKNQSINFKDVGRYIRVSVELFSAILVGVIIGIILDKYFNTSPLFLFIFLLLGSFAGLLNVYRTVKRLGFEVGFKKKNGKFFK